MPIKSYKNVIHFLDEGYVSRYAKRFPGKQRVGAKCLVEQSEGRNAANEIPTGAGNDAWHTNPGVKVTL